MTSSFGETPAGPAARSGIHAPSIAENARLCVACFAAIRRISSLYTTYNFELGVDLRESLKLCDVGDVFCPANITKSHDQITKAVQHVLAQGAMPMIMGGDHSIGFPCARGVAQAIEGKLGIIHLDRHIDTQEKDMDEIMHTCPWFHATNIPNCPPTNLVQVGIGG